MIRDSDDFHWGFAGTQPTPYTMVKAEKANFS